MDLDTISKKLAHDAKDFIGEVCQLAYTRSPCSENEKKAQEYLKKKSLEYGADEVEQESFHAYPRFFRYWPILSFILFVIGLVSYIFSPLIGFIFITLAILNLILKMFSFTFLDVIFPKKESSNVIAKLKCKNHNNNNGNPKRILILGGHTDSNYEYPILSKLGVKGFKALTPIFIWYGIVILGFLASIIIGFINKRPVIEFSSAIWSVFTHPDYIFYIALIGTPFLGWILINFIHDTPVPGANDNLSSVSINIQILKYISEHPEEKPANLEIWFIYFGCEEAGMMGSKDLSKKVRDQLDSGNFPAESVWVVNFDSVGSDGPLDIGSKEGMYRCTYLPEVYTQLAESAKKVGIEYRVKSNAGGTDSAPFGRLKIPATGIICMGDGSSPPNWHSLDDTPENVDEKGLIHSIKLILQFLKDTDDKLT